VDDQDKSWASHICYLPPLHIKLGLISSRKWIKIALDLCIKCKCPCINDGKIKEEAFVGSHARELIQDLKFEDRLSDVEKAAWKSLKNVTTKFFFLANHKAENSHDIVADPVQSYTAVGCYMSLQVCFVDGYLDFFP